MKLLLFIFNKFVPKSSCLLVMLLIFNYSASNAQLLFSNGGSITINTGAQLSIKGASEFDAGSTVTNNGLIDQTGNFTNNSGSNLFGTSTGTVDLNGGIQQINGTSTTTFNNLELNGSGNKSIAILTETGGTGSGVLDLNNRFLNSIQILWLLKTLYHPESPEQQDLFIAKRILLQVMGLYRG
jgi:hypothetical protein